MDKGVAGLSVQSLLSAGFLSQEHPVLVVEWRSRRILAASENVERIFGYRPDELIGQSTAMLHVDEASFIRFGEMTEPILAAEQQAFHCFYRMARRDGRAFETEHMLGIVRNDAGEPVAAVSVVRDLSDAYSLSAPLTGAAGELRALRNNLPGAMFQRVKRPDGTVRYDFRGGNLAARFGLPEAALLEDAEHILQRLYPDDRSRLADAMDRTEASLSACDVEMRAQGPDGRPRWLRSISQPKRLDDGGMLWSGIFLDVTEQREAEASLRQMATHDTLTGLPNTATYDQRLQDAIAEAERSGKKLLVAVIDIERFHTINESLGFPYGDAALREIGRRLRTVAEGNDLVARYQGDEFLLLFQDLSSGEEAINRANQVMGLFREPMDLGTGQLFSLKISIGMSLYPDDGTSPDALRRTADLALHRARRTLGRRYEFYSREMTRDVLAFLETERRLRDAIGERAIVPHYQPQYACDGGRLYGLEMLARWPQADGTEVSPARFIPVAEDTGLIRELGESLVEQAVADIARWRADGHAVPPVAINVSAHQIRGAGFLEGLQRAAAEHGLTIGDLTVEITESAFLLDFEGTREILERMAADGVRFSIDDFGTGFSSLSYLSRLPFRELKIDRSFVTEVGSQEVTHAVTHGIVQLGHALGMTVVAEGVETRDQLDRLRRMGCDAVQGYLVGRPVCAADIVPVLQDGSLPH